MREVAPAIVAAAAPSSGTANAINPHTSPLARILVVKDGAIGGAYLRQLQAKRFEVEVCAHGEKIIAALSARRHDAIIIEQCESPDAGWTLLHFIRIYLGWCDLPIVVIGRNTNDGSAERRWREYGVARVFERAGISGVAVARCIQQLLSLVTPPLRPQPYIVAGSAVMMNPASALRFMPSVATHANATGVASAKPAAP
jgi:hypothetical protein